MPKYDWHGVPEDVKYIATDSNGSVFGYDEKPDCLFHGKFMHVTDFLYYPKDNWIAPYKSNWYESLEVRPSE